MDQNRKIAEMINDTRISSDAIYVVRPSTDFADENDPFYLERHFPDLFPFGKAGFREFRKPPISKKALMRYYLNLSTRQFQKPDFLFPVHNLLVRQEIANEVFFRARLPSKHYDSDGINLSKGETFSQVPLEDLKKLAAYKAACADASTKRTHWPDAPVSENGIAQDLFTTVDLASRPIQHSQAAAHRNRNDMYAAHNSNGKADIWLTITPRDDLSHLVVSYGKGFEERAAKCFELPSENFRLAMLAERPVAAELYFERVLNIVFDRVIGWDQKKSSGTPRRWNFWSCEGLG